MPVNFVFLMFLIICTSVYGEEKEEFTVTYRDHKGSHSIKVTGSHGNNYAFKVGHKKLNLATLNWSPYISQGICRHGWVFQSTVALLHSMGYGASIVFYPWARAVSAVESGKADILFPEYFIEPEAPSDVFSGTRRLDHLTLSKSFGWGPIAFITRKDFDTDVYKGKLSNLLNERIGVVRGYQNTPEFDLLMDRGEFSIVTAVNDLNNVELLINNRVNLIIGDPEVIYSEIRRSDKLAQEKQRIMNEIKVIEPILQMNALFYAVSKRTVHDTQLLVELNKAIDTFLEYGIFDAIKYDVKTNCQKLNP